MKKDVGNKPKPRPVRVGLDGSKLPVHMQLRAQKVGQKTLHRYLASIEEFEAWAKQRSRKITDKTLDKHVTTFLTHMFEAGREITDGTYLVYALQLLRCEVAKDHFLVCAKQALAGWRKSCPGNMRLPVPEEFLHDAATFALEESQVEMAFLIALQLDSYLRPSEILGLTCDNIGRPAGKRYPHFSIVVAPSTLGQVTKTGQSDDSILLGDRSHNTWMKEAMRLYLKRVDHHLFPNTTLSGYENFMRKACLKLKYKTNCVMPHIVRHSAASNDCYHQRRGLSDIAKRGRWQSRASVLRYEKHALLLQSWKQAAVSRKSDIQKRSQVFISLLLSNLR